MRPTPLANPTTPVGSVRFEQARGRVAQLLAKEREDVTDAEVLDYLARGERELVREVAEAAVNVVSTK